MRFKRIIAVIMAGALLFGASALRADAKSENTYGVMKEANKWQKWDKVRTQKTKGYIYMKMSGWAWNGAISFRLHNAKDKDKVFTSTRTISVGDTQKKEIASGVKAGTKFKLGAKSKHQCGIDIIWCYNDDRWDGKISWNG